MQWERSEYNRLHFEMTHDDVFFWFGPVLRPISVWGPTVSLASKRVNNDIGSGP
jgi:hypothetical protein